MRGFGLWIVGRIILNAANEGESVGMDIVFGVILYSTQCIQVDVMRGCGDVGIPTLYLLVFLGVIVCEY